MRLRMTRSPAGGVFGSFIAMKGLLDVGSYVATKLFCCEELAGSYMAKKGLLVATRCYEGVAGSYVACQSK